MDGDDIADNMLCESFHEALQRQRDHPGSEIELVRNRLGGGYNDRSWAAVKDHRLPDFFSYGEGEFATKVPKRFHAECAAAKRKTTNNSLKDRFNDQHQVLPERRRSIDRSV